jgi:DNA (cytosine-5)-methyltransferase 1
MIKHTGMGSGETQNPAYVMTYAKTHKPMSNTDAEGWSPQDHSPTITYWPRDRSDAGTDVAVVQPLAFDAREFHETPWDAQEKRIHDVRRGVAPTLSSRSKGGGTVDGWFAQSDPPQSVVQTMSVRRLTPTECERLQGFPDGWTAIPWKRKPASECPDGPRYRALGNSMAVNVMRWIGRRIEMVDAL